MKQVLYCLISGALHGIESYALPSDVLSSNWAELQDELQAQSVHILPASIINAIELPENEKKSYLQVIGLNIQQFYTVLEEQTALLALLSDDSIPAVILKGMASAVNYPYPEYRCMGDIDVLVPPEYFEKAYRILRKHYQALSTADGYYRHIEFTTESGVEIELHRCFSSSGNKEQDRIFDETLYKAISNRVYSSINGYVFPMLPPLENGLVLIGHINQHLGNGLGLRQIIDWMCYVEQYLDDAMWEKFAPIAEQIGMRKLAVITTAMCRKYFGMLGDRQWCQTNEEDDCLCDELMDYIFSHGNFGRKTGFNHTTVSFIRRFRNPIRGLRFAQEIGLRTWNTYKKHRWLRPFAWVYQLFRWANDGVNRGIRLEDILRNRKVEHGETDLLERLGVTRR